MVWAKAPDANANAETKVTATIRERISALLRKAGGKPEHKLNPPFVMLFRLARKGSPEAISEWPLLPVPVKGLRFRFGSHRLARGRQRERRRT